MKINLKRTVHGLVPIDKIGQELLDKWKFDETREVSITKTRTSKASNAFHAVGPMARKWQKAS